MRVLHLISSSGFYGAENVLFNLMVALKKNGHRPCLVCIKNSVKSDPEIFIKVRHEGIKSIVVATRNRFDFRAIGQIKRFIKEEKIDLIHSHGYKSDFYGLIVSKLSGTPIVATLHLWTGEDKKVKFYDWLDKLIIKKFDYLVAVSPLIYNETLAAKVRREKLTLILNGINTDVFNPEKNSENLRDALGLKDSFVIGIVGRLAEQKGHAYLLEAFKQVVEKVDNVKLLIVGDGPLKDSLWSTVYGLRSKDRVIFTGFRTDMTAVYKSMDIFALPSLTEGLPLVLLEAMSMGLPVVATKVGGVPYAAENDAALLVSPGNSQELCEALTALLKDATLRKKYGERARDRVVTEFSAEKMYKKYAEIYRSITGGNTRAHDTRAQVKKDIGAQEHNVTSRK